MRAAIGGVCALAVIAGVLVMVSSAVSDATSATVVLAPHGGAPTIYAGSGDRAQLDGLWRFRRDISDVGLDKGFQSGKFNGDLVRVPYVPDATRISGRRGIAVFRGTVGWYRTKIDVPADGTYAIRFESVNHKAQVFVDGKRVGAHTGEYLPFEVQAFLRAGARHTLVVRADWRGPTAMKRDGWHRLWFNFGGINRGVSIRRIGNSELMHPKLRTRLAAGAALVDLAVHVHNNAEARQLGVKGTLSRGDRNVAFEFPAEAIAKEGTEVLETSVRVDAPDLWSPRAPNLWDLALEVPGEATYRARVGLREVRAAGSQLLLNGAPVRLRGASIHEDVFGRGDGLRPIDQDRIVEQLKTIDANATRAQHPLDPGLLERLDAAGI
ncbi:MAG: sugar-binding domain-containing protein, partial [Solirubrobacteraceae bacterium]